MFSLLLFYKIPWWPAQRETGKKKKGKREACPILHTVETSGGRRGAQCLNLSIGRCTLCQINPVRVEGRDSDRRGGRAEGWGLRAWGTRRSSVSTHCQFVLLLGCHQLVSWFVCLLDWWVFVMFSSSSPRPSRAEVSDRQSSDWPTSLRTGRQMVSLSLRGKTEVGWRQW